MLFRPSPLPVLGECLDPSEDDSKVLGDVSTILALARPRWLIFSEKLALFSHNSPPLKLTKAPLSWTWPSRAALTSGPVSTSPATTSSPS